MEHTHIYIHTYIYIYTWSCMHITSYYLFAEGQFLCVFAFFYLWMTSFVTSLHQRPNLEWRWTFRLFSCSWVDRISFLPYIIQELLVMVVFLYSKPHDGVTSTMDLCHQRGLWKRRILPRDWHGNQKWELEMANFLYFPLIYIYMYNLSMFLIGSIWPVDIHSHAFFLCVHVCLRLCEFMWSIIRSASCAQVKVFWVVDR